MPTLTEQLQELLTNGTASADFKQSAMELARQGADLTVRSDSEAQYTLLDVLSLQNTNGANNSDIAELVELNANVLTSTDRYGRTALQSLIDALTQKSCSFDNFKHSAMTLAKTGANITLKSTLGTQPTLLHVLARRNKDGANNDDIAALVTLNKKVLTSTDWRHRTALQSLIDILRKEKCTLINIKKSAMTLARQGADLSLKVKTYPGNTLLHVLVLNRIDENNDEINTLIDLNNNVLNYKNGLGRTPVHSFLRNNRNASIDVIERLLSITNLHLQDKHNETLLHAACHGGNLPAVEYLFGKGLSLTALTRGDQTLIHYAVSYGNRELLKWLIDKRQIDINAKNLSDETALHLATRKNKLEMVQLLTTNGADLTIKNRKGLRASEIASKMGYHDLVPYLFNAEHEFFQKIQAMHSYGLLLKDQGVSKGLVAIALAQDLTTMAKPFFEQEATQRNFAAFESGFSRLLHSKDQEMSAYRIAWGIIVANIAIALTGVGLLFIAGKLIHSKVTEGRALFFFQKSKTTGEEKIADIEQSARLIAHSASNV